jgi:hypothetical protein
VVGLLREQRLRPGHQDPHPQLLRSEAFVKERVENGKPIDLDMFGAFVADAAEIKRKAK